MALGADLAAARQHAQGLAADLDQVGTCPGRQSPEHLTLLCPHLYVEVVGCAGIRAAVPGGHHLLGAGSRALVARGGGRGGGRGPLSPRGGDGRGREVREVV